jgi:uncharacterized repeat protein (TIGR03803 family)
VDVGAISGAAGYPAAGLIDVNGTLYGTTVYGGGVGLGTVFRVTQAGAAAWAGQLAEKRGQGKISADGGGRSN